MLLGKLNPFAFVLSLGAGLLLVYMFAPRPRVVCKFPNPLNAGTTFYKTPETEECYVYESEEVECDDDAREQPQDEECEEPVVRARLPP